MLGAWAIVLPRRLRHLDAARPACSDHPGCTPRRKGMPPLSHQITDVLGERGPTRGPSLAQAPPVRAPAFGLPGDNDAGLHARPNALPAWPEVRPPRPAHAIGRAEPWTTHGLSRDGSRMLERHNLQGQSVACREEGAHKGQQGREHRRPRQSPHGNQVPRAAQKRGARMCARARHVKHDTRCGFSGRTGILSRGSTISSCYKAR